MKKLLLAPVAAFALAATAATMCFATPARPAVGPSFNCAAPAVAAQPLAQLICSSDRLARADLSYVITYMALRQISNDTDRATMRAEANAFTVRVTDECSIPKTGWLGGRSVFEMEVNCLVGKFDEERNQLFKRLSGEAMDEAWLTPEQAITIQQLLKEKGFLPANALLDGVFGPTTREAIGNWQRSKGQPSTGFGSAALLVDLQGSTPAATPAPNSVAYSPRREQVISRAQGLDSEVSAVANVSTEGMPREVLSCSKSSIEKVSDRFGKRIGSVGSMGSFVAFANGGSSVSYSVEEGIKNSWPGDRVLICLVHIPDPNKCPVGDERGRVYTVTNLRSLESWTLSPDQHMCGGA